MNDPTVELTEQDERNWRAERQEEIAALCWQKCQECSGRGFTIEHWPADDGGLDHVLKPTCPTCEGERRIFLDDPWRVGALYDAADDARETMGVECYTRIPCALSLAIKGAVSLPWPPTVASQTVE